MVKLVRAMVSLMTTVAECCAATWRLSVEPTVPVGGRCLGAHKLLPGCLVLTITTESVEGQLRHFIGYWSQDESA